MTSEKTYDNAQRLDALVGRTGTLESQVATLQAQVTALQGDASWTDTGGLTNSWGKGTGYLRYKLISPGWVALAAQALTIGTDTDGTTIITAANGLPTGYRPGGPKQIMASTNALRTGAVGTATEPCWLEIQSGGSIQCFGIAVAATFLNCFAAFPIDI